MARQKILELGLEEERVKQQIKEQQKSRFPKLQIWKFISTITNWVWIWDILEEETDKSKKYAAITKFSFLRELLSSQSETKVSCL